MQCHASSRGYACCDSTSVLMSETIDTVILPRPGTYRLYVTTGHPVLGAAATGKGMAALQDHHEEYLS